LLFVYGYNEIDLMEKETKQIVNNFSYELETIHHGKPSGIDNSIIIYGGQLIF